MTGGLMGGYPLGHFVNIPESGAPRIETQYAVTITAKVEAKLRGTIRVDRTDVAKWAECEPEEVTTKLVEEYVEECEEAWDENDVELVDVTDWERVDAEHEQTFRVRITPPGWVPLIEDEHEHTDRPNRDMCRAGRCYLDTIVPRSASLSRSGARGASTGIRSARCMPSSSVGARPTATHVASASSQLTANRGSTVPDPSARL